MLNEQKGNGTSGGVNSNVLLAALHAHASYLLINGELHQVFQTPYPPSSSFLPPVFSVLRFLPRRLSYLLRTVRRY